MFDSPTGGSQDTCSFFSLLASFDFWVGTACFMKSRLNLCHHVDASWRCGIQLQRIHSHFSPHWDRAKLSTKNSRDGYYMWLLLSSTILMRVSPPLDFSWGDGWTCLVYLWYTAVGCRQRTNSLTRQRSKTPRRPKSFSKRAARSTQRNSPQRPLPSPPFLFLFTPDLAGFVVKQCP